MIEMNLGNFHPMAFESWWYLEILIQRILKISQNL